jgi:hypothetical protein
MIQLEITDSPDRNVVATITYHQNQIYLGAEAGDLKIRDPGLRPSHAMLEVVGADLLFHPQKAVDFYLLNGKRATTIRKLNVGDRVTIGGTQLRIGGFAETPRETKKEFLDRKLAQLVAEASPRLAVIETLTKLQKQ